MDSTPEFVSEYPIERWLRTSEYADELGVPMEYVMAAAKAGLLHARKYPSQTWRIPPELATDEVWCRARRGLSQSRRATVALWEILFGLEPGQAKAIDRALDDCGAEDHQAQIMRWTMRGITAHRRSVTPAMKRDIRERHEGLCAYCAQPATPAEYDHVIPASQGGGGGENVVLACKPCNRSKRDAYGFSCETCGRLTWELRGVGRNRCGCRAA